MADHEEEPQETHKKKQTFWEIQRGHDHIHIRNFPKEVLTCSAVGVLAGFMAAVFKGNMESQLIVDPKRLPPPGQAAKRFLTYPAYCATLFGGYAVAKEFCNAVRGVHDRDWVTSFTGGAFVGLFTSLIARMFSEI